MAGHIEAGWKHCDTASPRLALRGLALRGRREISPSHARPSPTRGKLALASLQSGSSQSLAAALQTIGALL